MSLDPITAGMDLVNKIIGLFPTAEQREAAKLALATQQGQQVVAETQQQLSAIIAEASSPDPWTSRARPSFLYVIYVLILASLPMGLVAAFTPDIAQRIITGFQAWLAAIPDPMVNLFGAAYLGYTGSRTFEKWKGVAK